MPQAAPLQINKPSGSPLKPNTLLRSKNSFNKQTQKEHHDGKSILRCLHIDLLKMFVLDYHYLHLVCEGITKRFLLRLKESRGKNIKKFIE